MTHSISNVLVMSFVLGLNGCVLTNNDQKGEWRQDRHSHLDTFYPGVKFGMSPEEVRSKVPSSYRIEMKGNFMQLRRHLPDHSPEKIEFRFKGGRLIDTSDSAPDY